MLGNNEQSVYVILLNIVAFYRLFYGGIKVGYCLQVAETFLIRTLNQTGCMFVIETYDFIYFISILRLENRSFYFLRVAETLLSQVKLSLNFLTA